MFVYECKLFQRAFPVLLLEQRMAQRIRLSDLLLPDDGLILRANLERSVK